MKPLAVVGLLTFLSACSSHSSGPPGTDGGGGGGGGADLGGVADLGSDAGTPPSVPIPIDHVIVVVKENHTFDNYFGSFPGAEGTQMAASSTGLVKVGRPPLVMTRDLCHEHQCAVDDWNHGAMDHWDLGDTKNQNDQLAFAQYIEADIPNYWQYAKHYALGDHFFANVLGPSFPGHMFVLAAQTGWAYDNPSSYPWGCEGGTIPTLDHGTCTQKEVTACFDFPTVVDALPSGITWKFYGSTLPTLQQPFGQVWSMFDAIKHVRQTAEWKSNVVDFTQFDKDVDNGTLPNIVYLVDQDLYSEHPPFNICDGENWTVDRINHVMNSKYWNSTAILMVWDDFGGWYDHVAPPKQYGCDSQNPYGLGFRLPLIIVSPYAKPGTVYHRVAQHASIPKFIEAVFKLPSLASQDPAAQDGPETDDLTSAFDWTQTPNPPLPLATRNCFGQR
jgi:phospholipase C